MAQISRRSFRKSIQSVERASSRLIKCHHAADFRIRKTFPNCGLAFEPLAFQRIHRLAMRQLIDKDINLLRPWVQNRKWSTKLLECLRLLVCEKRFHQLVLPPTAHI